MIQKNWQELIKPNRIDVSPGTDPLKKAKIVVEPLERGYGMTLGNSLRRVLLSSLQGGAVICWVSPSVAAPVWSTAMSRAFVKMSPISF